MQDLRFRDAQGLSHNSGYVDVHGAQTEGWMWAGYKLQGPDALDALPCLLTLH